MRKSGKILLGSMLATVAVIAAIILIVVFTNLNQAVKYGVETYGPSATGTPVSLNHARVSILSGKGELNGLVIGNPQGFASDYALKLNKIKVSLAPHSLTEDVIVVEQLIIDSATLNSEFKGIQNNLQQIRNNRHNALASTQTEGLKAGVKQLKKRTKEKLDELDKL